MSNWIPTESDKLACIVRELEYRKRVYARLVETGKMSDRLRQREIDLMQAILEDYRERATAERLI